jgi:hypothetical protein
MSSERPSGGGVDFMGLLAILFIGLKLGGVIDWSWWWVLSPMWGPPVVALSVLLIALVALSVLWAACAIADKVRR